MITVKELKKLLENIPDDAVVSAYEGEDIGFNISTDKAYWWIRANPDDEPDNQDRFYRCVEKNNKE